MDDLELRRHVQGIWAAQRFLVGVLDYEGLPPRLQVELNEIIRKVSDAGCAVGDFEGRVSGAPLRMQSSHLAATPVQHGTKKVQG